VRRQVKKQLTSPTRKEGLEGEMKSDEQIVEEY
jgi:hypothetical protein